VTTIKCQKEILRLLEAVIFLVRIEKSIEIKASPEKVWEMLAFDKAVEWMEGWKSVQYISEVHTPKDKYRAGTSAHITDHVKYDLEITESLENKKMAYRSKGIGGRVTMTVTHILEPVEDGTKFTLVCDYEMPWWSKWLPGKMLGQRGTGKVMEKSLKKLKSILEK